MSTALRNDLTEGNVTRQMIRFAIPFLLANLLQTCYSLVDMIIVGRVMGSAGLSAISNGGDLLNLFTVTGMGFTAAGQIIISQYLGARKEDEIRNTIGTLFTVVLVISACFTVVGLLFTDAFLTALQVPAEAFEQARNYCLVCFGGIVFIYGYNAVSNVLRGLGDSKHPLYFVAISSAINVALDLIFVAGLGWGARGAALATVIGQGTAFVTAIIFLFRRRDAFGFDFALASFWPKKHILILLCKMGIPNAFRNGAVNFSMLFVTAHINAFGVAVSAISGVGNKITSIATTVTMALEMAGASMIGQNFGAGKMDRVKKVVHITLALGLTVCLLLSAVLILFPEQVFRIWSDDAEVLALIPQYLPVVVLNLIGFALRAPCLTLVNGLGFVTMNFVVGILDGVVLRLGLAMLLGEVLGWGITGFWYGTVLAGFAACIVVGPYYLSGAWKKRKPIARR